uniref:Eyes absent homolog n=1 Tax=Panagrolaimus sp. JU765 TaxID=591449 RepID=A0AC34QV89_9BILA
MISNSGNSNPTTAADLGKTVLQSETFDSNSFINSWTCVLPPNVNSLDQKLDTSMPVGIPNNQTTSAALEAVYGSSSATTDRNLANNPYYNAVNYANPSAYNASYNQYYQLTANIRNPTAAQFANYFGAAAAGVNPVYYGPGGYNGSNLVAAAGFDYPYTSGANYYTGGNRTSGSTYYNPTLPYAGLGLGETVTPSTSNGSNQVSPYSVSGSKTDHKIARRNKKKKTIGGLSAEEPNHAFVFIWELEDLCQCLAYRQNYSVLNSLIERILLNGFQLQHLDECDQANIEDANVDESVHEVCFNASSANNGQMKASPDKSETVEDPLMSGVRVNAVANEGLQRMAARYQRVRTVYNQCKDSVDELLTLIDVSPMQQTALRLNELIAQADVYHNLESYRNCLQLAVERSGSKGETYTNVVLSSEPLSSTMAKLLITGLSAYIPVENIYSSHKFGRADVLDRILHRYKKASIVISSNPETSEIAKKEKTPFWRISNNTDVDKFHHALDKYLLN